MAAVRPQAARRLPVGQVQETAAEITVLCQHMGEVSQYVNTTQDSINAHLASRTRRRARD